MTTTNSIKNQVLIGFLISIGVILLNYFVPEFSIGFPVVPNATVQEKYFIIGFLIPIAEEIAFRVVLPGILIILGQTIFRIQELNVFIKGALNGLIFAIFHFTAYGASIEAASASFILAALFGLGMSLIADWQDPDSTFPLQIITVIIHISFNTWLLSNLFIVVGA